MLLLLIRFGSALAFCVSTLNCVAAPELYRVTDLGDFPGGPEYGEAYSINNTGQVVGVSGTNTGLQAFRWSAECGLQPLDTLPGGAASSANSINRQGFATGHSGTTTGTAAVRWSSGDQMRKLGTLSMGFYDTGTAINDYGQVAGWSVTSMGLRAFVWTGRTGIVELGDLPGGDGRSVAYGLNNKGMAVGSSDVQSPRRLTDHAFVWTRETGLRDIGTLRGPSADYFSEARAVNDLGEVVGASDAAKNKHAFLWCEDTGMHDLGALPNGDGYSMAFSVNDRGQVVGESNTTRGLTAFVWTRAVGMRDLNELIDPDDPLKATTRVSTAYDINDRGQIVGSAEVKGITRAILLTPKSLPDSTPAGDSRSCQY